MVWFCYRNVTNTPLRIVENRLGHGTAYAAYPDGALISRWGSLTVPPGSIVRIPEGTQHQPSVSPSFQLVPHDEFMKLHSEIAARVLQKPQEVTVAVKEDAEPRPAQTTRTRKAAQK